MWIILPEHTSLTSTFVPQNIVTLADKNSLLFSLGSFAARFNCGQQTDAVPKKALCRSSSLPKDGLVTMFPFQFFMILFIHPSTIPHLQPIIFLRKIQPAPYQVEFRWQILAPGTKAWHMQLKRLNSLKLINSAGRLISLIGWKWYTHELLLHNLNHWVMVLQSSWPYQCSWQSFPKLASARYNPVPLHAGRQDKFWIQQPENQCIYYHLSPSYPGISSLSAHPSANP